MTLPPRPKIYDMATADGVPYWKIALLHLDSIASTVVQKCIYWGTDEQCGFCGIELTRGEQTVPVKTPAQLAEVCTAARDYDHAVDVTLTTGSLNRRDRGAIYISRCAAAIKEASGMPIQVQFEPPDDLRVLDEVRRAASTRSASTSRRSIPRCWRGSRPARPSAGSRATSARGRRRSTCSAAGRSPRTCCSGMGEREELIIEGCRRAIAMGVYPFVVPLRPVPGTLMADAEPPDPEYVARVYAEVSLMLADAGFDHLDAKAGCARCQACSGHVGVGARHAP